MGEGNLHHIEVPNGPKHGKVHGAEITYEAIQILNVFTPLAIRYLQKGDYLEMFLGRQGEGNPVGVDHQYQNLLDRLPVPVHG